MLTEENEQEEVLMEPVVMEGGSHVGVHGLDGAGLLTDFCREESE